MASYNKAETVGWHGSDSIVNRSSPTVLSRELGVVGAVWMGMGSILGTGVFVSLGIASDIAGPAVLLAVGIAAVVATCNGLSAAQLAANHPVSGGAYEYGYRYLNPLLGFTAGWLFLIAKSASAATAALGFAGYLLHAVAFDQASWSVPLALVAVLVLTLIVLSGLRRSNWMNTLIVSVTLAALLAFIVGGWPRLLAAGSTHLVPFFPAERSWESVLHASALMFVAYTGYGRITTMGEEVRHPERTIPVAIITTLVLTMLLYGAIALVSIGALGPTILSANQSLAPLEAAAQALNVPGLALLISIGAITAMLGVLLNLILGLSRVLLAMGRRNDMPRITARLNASGTAPAIATLVMGSAIALLVLLGNVKTTWSFSAFAVLSYYAIMNLASLQLSHQERLYPRWVSWVGFISCLFLALWVEPSIWMGGLGLVAVGWCWKLLLRALT